MTTATRSLGTADALPELATMPAAQASTEALYGGEGANLSQRFRRGPRNQDPRYQASFKEAMGLYTKVLGGSKRAALDFQEAMSTSDFAFLFGDIIDRQLLPAYRELPVQWQQLARPGRVRDFREVKRFTIDGGEGILEEVAQGAPYPAAALTDGEYSYSVAKRGKRLPILWETLINDDLDAFADMPSRLARSARRSEEKFATQLYAGTSGPNSTFFSTANTNLLSDGHPLLVDVDYSSALSVGALQAAMTLLGEQTDTDGNPIYIEFVTLVVPPALEVPAQNILNATEILSATGGGSTGNDQLRVANWMRNRVKLLVNPWLPIISSGDSSGRTSWYLFADPGSGRPAMEFGRLIGHEEPELFMKSPNAVRVGGGLADAMDGDFDTDAIDMKVRHVFGGTLMDPKMAVASEGTGVGS